MAARRARAAAGDAVICFIDPRSLETTREQAAAFHRGLADADYVAQCGVGCEPRALFYALRPANCPCHSLDLWKYWRAIKVPILVLRVPADLARDMVRRNPSARVLEIEGCGHAPSLMSHEQIERVCEFLRVH
jgi:pimeloyl-ACP methyl ester carboxylesterase